MYPVNDEPVIDSAPETASCDEDSDGADFTVTFHDVDCADSDLVFYAYAHNANSASPVVLNVDITIDRQTGEAHVNAKPVANANGTVDIVVGVSDGITSVTHTVHMTVNPVDDAPVLLGVSQTLYEDMDTTVPVVTPDSDVDGDSLIVSIEEGDGPAHGTAVVNADGTITYTPDADYNGTDSLVFTVTDDTEAGLSSTQTASFTITPVNDQPEIWNLDYYQTTREDTPAEVTLTVVDVDNDLSASSCYTITSDNQELIPDGSISISQVSGTNMKITLTPVLNAYGTAIITVVASDGELEAEAQFQLVVQPVNDTPTAADDTASVDETVGNPAGTTSTTINLTANDTDIEPGTLKVIAITNISIGTVQNNGDGTVTYSVDGDFNGAATFDYTIMDVGGATATATVTVTVNAQNDPPRASNDWATTTEDNDVTIAVLSNDSDPEGDTLSIAEVSVPAHGTATISGTSIVYSPDENYNGTDSFTYTVSDGNGGTVTAHVYVAISAVNDAPEIAKYPTDAGEWTMDEDTTAAFTFVVSDAETSSESLIITIDSQDKAVIANTGIVLSTNEEGQKVITVTPQENRNGVVPVVFHVTDGALTTTVTWNITIAAVNDAPEITTTDLTTPEDTAVSSCATATDVENDELTFSLGLEPAHGNVTVNADGTYTYTPNANYVGEDIFGIYVNDGHEENNLDYDQVHVIVTPVNDKPDAVDDTDSTAEDTAVTVNVTANDTDVDLAYGDTLAVTSVGAAAHGTTEIVEGGVRYTPAENWSGTDSFTYTITDTDGERDTATVTVTVNPVNDAPTAVDDTDSTAEDIAVTIDVTANDTDVDTAYGDEISVSSVGTAAHGTVAIVEGGVRYTPTADWNGEDSFTYTITDGDVESTATVTVTVNPVNDLPYFTANPANMSLTEDLADGSSEFTVGDVETPAASLTVTFISSDNTTLVDSGDVTITSGEGGVRTVVVNPNDNRNGTAHITLRVTDADGGYAQYTFTVTVTAVNDVPSAQNDSATTNENTAVTINVLANDDVDTAAGNEGDTLTLLTVGTPTYGSVAIVDNKAVYTPDANRTVTESYTDTFTYTMQDASEATSGATVTVTVTPVNDAPIITDPIADVEFDEDAAEGTGEIAFTVTDEEDDDDTLSVTVASSNTALIPVANITISNPEGGDGSERTVQAVAVADGYGSADITLTVTDDGGRTDSVTFTVTVKPVDDPLGAGTMDYTVVEDVQKRLMVLDDADVDDPSYLSITAIVTPASHGTVTIAEDGKSLYYITDLNSNEADSFVYRVHDAFGNVDYDITANITVTPVNDAPVVTMTEATEYTTYEGVAVSDIPFTVTDVDNDVDTEVTLSAVSSNPVLVLGGLSIDEGTGNDRTIDVQPYRKWNGTTTITITADDGEDEGSASFTFIVNSVNEAPVANDDTFTVSEDALTFLDVLDNDTDGDLETNPETEHLRVYSVTDEDPNATITVPEGGSGVNIQPNANYNGPVTFTYVVADAENATSNTATVTVTVTQVNDAPEADDEPDVTTNEDTAVTIDVLDGDTDTDQMAGLNADPEAEVLSISLTGATGPSHGSIEVVDGKIVYTPVANYNGTDSFEYYVTDGEAQDLGVVTVTIAQVNDDPVAGADSTTTPEDTAVTIDVLSNDTDVDTGSTLNQGTLHSRDDFSISLEGVTTAPSHGDISVVDGKIVYTPDANWYGTDTFTYFILDGHGGSDEGTVTVAVGSVNDLPYFTANPANMSLTEDLADGSSEFTVGDVETPAADLTVMFISSDNTTLVDSGDVTITSSEGGVRTVVVNPNDNQNGTAHITLRVTDGNGGYKEYAFTVTVAAVNDDPVGDDTSGIIDEDTSYTVAWGTLTSDVDIVTNADSLGVTITTQAAHGTAVVSGGNIVYTPNEDWNGVDSFVYTVTDSAGATDTGTITVTVTQVNDAPVADDEPDVTTNEDTAVTIDVLDGDTDTDQKEELNAYPGDEVLSISLTGATGPLHGSVEVVDGEIVYTPNANYNGEDTFEYYVTDGEAQDLGEVTVTIAQVNDDPVAGEDTATTNEDTAVTINVLANDTDVDTGAGNDGTLHSRDDFSISLEGVTTAPANGDVAVVDGKIVYTPDANWYGTDTFTYFILDGHGGSDEGTVTVTVNSVNDLPEFVTNPANMSLTEDLADGSSEFTVGDVETPAADLTVTFVSSDNTTLVDSGDVTITPGEGGVRTVVVNPNDNQNGTAHITLRVTDGDHGYVEYTFTVTVAAVNDDPVGDDTSGIIDEDTSYTVAWGTLTSDVDIVTNADSLDVTITTQAAHGTAVVSAGNIIYTPNANWNGEDSFVYTVTDSEGATDTGTITVTVTQVNDAPVADDEPDVTTNEDTAVTIDVLDGDTDTDQKEELNAYPGDEVLSISLTGATGPLHGSVEVVDGEIVYTPNANYNGEDTFEYYVTDGEAQDLGEVTVTIAQVNDDPVAVADTATTDEDTAVTIDVLANDTDVDTGAGNDGTLHSRDDFSISLEGVTTAPANGDVAVVDGKIVYTPDANWYGTDTFTYFILDGHGGSDEGTVTVTVGGDNDAPVAADDSASAEEDHTVTVNVLANDTDADPGDTLSFVSFLGDTSSLPGTLNGTTAGVVTFVPDANWNGSFTVQYQMRDADGLTDEATITITVNAVNDDPVAEGFLATTNEDTAKAIDVSGYISDVDVATNADSLTVTVETGDGPTPGSVSVSGTTITYTPAANWNGEDSFTYTVTDSAGKTDTGIITVTVAAVNDAPVADNDSATTNEDTPVTVDVLDGDTDVDTDAELNVTPQAAVTIGSVGTPAHGTAEIVEGKIVYTPAANWNGTDSFTYTVTDGEQTDTGTVSITVTPVNDNPVAEADFATTNDEDLVTVDVLANDTDVDTDDELNAEPDSHDDFTITAVGEPTNGTAVINAGKIDYTPDDTFAGVDSFTYTMSDGHGGSATATVTVTVLSVNDPPETPVVHTPVGGERYGGESTILVTWSGFDIDGDTLGYTLEYYDGSEWHVVQSGLTETEYEFEIPETLTSITDLQFRVNASDAEFTSDYGYSGTVEVDKDIPTDIVVTMTTADGRAYTEGTWTNQTVTVTAVSVEDASEVVFSYSIEDKVFSETDSRVVTSGVHTVYIRATDEFGNVSEFGGYLVRIDKQAPAEPQVSVAISGVDAVLSFTLSRDPGGSGNSYLIMPDGTQVTAGTGITWKTAKNGTFTFKLYDAAGNVTTFTVTVNEIDETAPVITCDSGSYTIGEQTEEGITATLSFTDSESVITARGYALSDTPAYSGAYKSYTGAIEITQPGTYYIHAYARNAFGLTTYETFGPFIVAAAENPETDDVPPEGDVLVDAGDVGDHVQVRTPGGEWTDSLTLENVEPGTYIIEVMDEDGNITTMEITITDEQIAKGQWKPTEMGGIDWYVWTVLGLALLLLLLLLFWRNVKVTMYPAGGGRPLRNVRRLRRRQNEVIVTVAGRTTRGSAYGRVTLSKAFTQRMTGKTLIVMQDDVQVLKVQIPEDAQERFEAIIERWAD